MITNNKRVKLLVSVFTVVLVFMSVFTIQVGAEFTGTNIARRANIDTPIFYSGVNPASRCIDGIINEASSGTVFNTWGLGAYYDPMPLTLTWSAPQKIIGTRVLWYIYSDAGLRWPSSATVEYLDLKSDTWVSLGNIGVEGKGEPNAGSEWVFNDIWNYLEFETPIVTNRLRMTVYRDAINSSVGFGINEWEVYGEPWEPQDYDINGDGVVNYEDLAFIMYVYGARSLEIDPVTGKDWKSATGWMTKPDADTGLRTAVTYEDVDVENNGVIDINTLQALIKNFTIEW